MIDYSKYIEGPPGEFHARQPNPVAKHEINIGDKVTHRQMKSMGVLEVIGLSKEIDWPGKGPVRKVFWKTLDPEVGYEENWTWDFALEIW
jgi:hypothetical protein